MRFVVVLDACVLYPAPLRDFLLRLATTGLFAAKWTTRIQDEWTSSLLARRPELEAQVARTRQKMEEALPDCLVTGYEPLMAGLTLPDPDDVHVLAAAIRCNAQAIVTTNTKDFPSSVLDEYDVLATHPDNFVEHQLDLSQGVVMATAKQHRAALRKPPLSVEAYLDTLAGQGLVVTADRLREFSELL